MSIATCITPEQQAILDGFTCERLTARPANRGLARNFCCERNPGLAEKLRDDAWYEDRLGVPMVYYIIKNPQGRIALYFSVKCGVLFNPDYVRDVLDRFDRKRQLLDAMSNRECQTWARDHVEELRSGSGIIPHEHKYTIRTDYKDAKQARRGILRDEVKEPNQKMIRVDEAFPAIELVHFCVNDWARADWRPYRMGHPLGETLFWQFVVPKMLEINSLIGCEYAYLFAADDSKDGTLTNYYETALHFDHLTNIGAIKPQYDFHCIFMGKRLHRLNPRRRESLDASFADEDPLGLEDYRKLFFENFNPIGEDIV